MAWSRAGWWCWLWSRWMDNEGTEKHLPHLQGWMVSMEANMVQDIMVSVKELVLSLPGTWLSIRTTILHHPHQCLRATRCEVLVVEACDNRASRTWIRSWKGNEGRGSRQQWKKAAWLLMAGAPTPDYHQNNGDHYPIWSSESSHFLLRHVRRWLVFRTQVSALLALGGAERIHIANLRCGFWPQWEQVTTSGALESTSKSAPPEIWVLQLLFSWGLSIYAILK